MPRYQVRERAFGFEIDGGPDRTLIKVMAEESCWAINHGGHLFKLGLFEIGELASLCAKIAISNWRPKKSSSSFFVEKWMHDLTRKTFCKIISVQFNRIRVKLDPTIINVQKSVFHSTMKAGEISIDPDFYKRASKYLLKDIVSYRPAAVALRYLGSPFASDQFTLPADDVLEFKIHSLEYGLRLDRVIELLENWKALYSPGGIPYTALNRTLMNCPAVSAYCLGRLHTCYLERPYFNRLELMLNIAAGDCKESRHKKVFSQSTEDDIKKSLKLVSESTHRHLPSIKFSSVFFLARYLNDFPEEHLNGKILGLTRKAIRWHSEQSRLTKEEILAKYGNIVFPSIPPIPNFDKNKYQLRYLSNAADVAIEAETMGHCIGNYVDKARTGESFLFHLDHLPSKTSASIEVNYPPEIKGFKRIGEDYYITISKEDFENGKPLPFLDAAYKIARSMLVASARVEAGSVIDFQKIKDAIARITKSAECIDDILTKAKTIITSGEKIRDAGDNFKREIDVSCQIINQILEGS